MLAGGGDMSHHSCPSLTKKKGLQKHCLASAPPSNTETSSTLLILLLSFFDLPIYLIRFHRGRNHEPSLSIARIDRRNRLVEMMKPEQYTHSVIAQLMNLNNVWNPDPPSSSSAIRVLSDEYLQKSASIGLCRSVSLQASRRGSFFRPDGSQGSRKMKQQQQPLVSSAKNVQNHLLDVKRTKSGVGLQKSLKIASGFRFARNQSASSLGKMAAAIIPDQETSLNDDDEEEEEGSGFPSSGCLEYSSPSPISVLEPCLSDNSDSLEETNSVMMMVSSDEDNEEQQPIKQMMMDSFEVVHEEGSRDFSYIVDALDEADFHGNESELPINPTVFYTLEKKYGEQRTWERWDRKLLFDRMNSALISIFQQQLRKKMFAPWRRRREAVEDELWTYLVKDEKVKEKEMQMKVEEKVVYGVKWLDLDEDIALAVAEIETSLIHELVGEMVS